MTEEERDIEIHSEDMFLRVGRKGAYVKKLSLDGEPLIVPASDGKETHGGATVMVPYANRIRDGSYSYNGKDYHFRKNTEGNSIHGFARDALFSVMNASETEVTLIATLEDNGYPSPIEVEITYSLTAGSFATDAKVRNPGKTSVPLMVGFHPYIAVSGSWSLKTDEPARKLEYEDSYFPSGKMYDFDFNSLPDLSGRTFDNTFLGGGTIRLESGGRTVRFERRNFPYFVVYNGEYSRGISVALEPMTGAPDCFNNGMGLISLNGHSAFHCSYRLVLE